MKFLFETIFAVAPWLTLAVVVAIVLIYTMTRDDWEPPA